MKPIQIIKKIGNIIEGYAKTIISTDEQKELSNKRLEICNNCVFCNKEAKQCTICRCYILPKSLARDETCPKNYW